MLLNLKLFLNYASATVYTVLPQYSNYLSLVCVLCKLSHVL